MGVFRTIENVNKTQALCHSALRFAECVCYLVFESVVKCAKLVKVNYFEMNMSSVDCLVEGMINDCSLSDMLTSNITVPPLLVLMCQKGNVLTTQKNHLAKTSVAQGGRLVQLSIEMMEVMTLNHLTKSTSYYHRFHIYYSNCFCLRTPRP